MSAPQTASLTSAYALDIFEIDAHIKAAYDWLTEHLEEWDTHKIHSVTCIAEHYAVVRMHVQTDATTTAWRIETKTHTTDKGKDWDAWEAEATNGRLVTTWTGVEAEQEPIAE